MDLSRAIAYQCKTHVYSPSCHRSNKAVAVFLKKQTRIRPAHPWPAAPDFGQLDGRAL